MVRVCTLSLLAALSLLASSYSTTMARAERQHVLQQHQHNGSTNGIQSIDNETICSMNTSGDQTCYPRIFVATKEFQIIQLGQDIPPGLHVQIDMTTGEQRARLMDEADADAKALAIVPDKEDEDKSQLPPPPSHPGMSLAYNTKMHEYIDRLVSTAHALPDRTQIDSLMQVLGELEDLVHETRHAEQLLRDPGAVSAFLRLSDPSASAMSWPSTVRRLSSMVLGASVQNNHKLQDIAFRANAIPSLLHAMSVDSDLRTAGKHIFALSALVRGHAGALVQFADRGGLRLLRDLNPMTAAVNDDNEYEARRLDLRIVRFIEDLFNAEFNPEVPRDAASLVAQNAATWCNTLAVRLIDSLEDVEAERGAGAAASKYVRRSAYARALQSLRAGYPATCVTSAELKHWLQDEIARVPKSGDESAEEYRQALTELDY
ncbi:nucleotide exchange factor sil1 [Kickxella alabastrina]|uniref:Nucleotide exchange factor sil1 n=1 Tax=Kickxella alabastrina TaxID=61397 RepID=A0ACC1I6G8_9FUNG|nr:nucleotide exchange factor sil1 [Kickxella alabastrina]